MATEQPSHDTDTAPEVAKDETAQVESRDTETPAPDEQDPKTRLDLETMLDDRFQATDN
jgi:hypothetical protein